MSQVSKHINSTNHKIHSYYIMSKLIVDLVSNKGCNKENSSIQLSNIQNLLLIIIVNIPEKDLSNVEGKSDTRKLHTSSITSYSTFLCSVRAMYNRVHHNQKQCLVLKSYIPRIDSWMGSKIKYNHSSENLVSELHNWIKKNLYVLQSPNLLYSIFVKFNGNILKKKKHLL